MKHTWMSTMRLALIVGLAILPSAAAAAEAVHLSLEEALARAQQQSEELQVARSQLLEARGRVREALAGALPQINGTVTFNRKIDSIFEQFQSDSGLGAVFSNSPFGSIRDWNLQLEATQLLYDGGKVGAAMRGARFFLRAAREQESETAQDLAFQVKAAYYAAAAAARLVEIAEGNLHQATDHKNQVALYFQQGSRAEYDLLRAQVDAANQEPAVVAARTGSDLAMLRLKRLINVPADAALVLDTPLESGDGFVPVVAGALEAPRRGGLAAAEANVGLQEQVLRAARASSWPTLSASTTLSHQAFPHDGEWPERDQFLRNWEASVRMTLPIFTGFRTSGETARARAAVMKARAERDQAREQVTLEIAEARARIDQTLSLLAARRETVRWAERAHSLADVRYRNGLSTQLEVSDARLAMQTAQVNQVEATRDYLVALAGLERALGRPLTLERKSLEQLSVSTLGGGSER